MKGKISSHQILFILLVFLTFTYAQVVNAAVFDENLMSQLEKEGYDKSELIKASLIAEQFRLPLKTILKLKPKKFNWNQVEDALFKMEQARKILADVAQLENNGELLSLTEEGFTEKQIAIIVYISSLYQKDLQELVSQAIKERHESKNQSELAYFQDVSLEYTTTEINPTVTSTQTVIQDPGSGYNPSLSSPYATLLKNTTEVVNPATGTLMIAETDLVLPGKNGLDFKLTRVFRSEKTERDTIQALYNDDSLTNNSYRANYIEKSFHIGLGWGFDIPTLQVPASLLHLGQGQTYLCDLTNKETGLKDLDIKEYILEGYNNANYSAAKYRLKHKSGINYYFDVNGRPIKITNRYGDEILLTWRLIDGQIYLEKIVDSVNRVITFNYTDNLVTVSVESGTTTPLTIKYYKTPLGDQQTKLVKVELPEQVEKSYTYTLNQTEFAFMAYTYPNIAPGKRELLLLKTRTNPFGGQQVYSYSNNYKRTLDPQGGYEKVFKLVNRYDYKNGQRQNEIDYQYFQRTDNKIDHTEIYYYGDKTTLDYAKKEILTFNDQGENIKTEVLFANKPDYCEIKQTTFIEGQPDFITLIKGERLNSFTWTNMIVDHFDIDYDDYANMVYYEDYQSGKTTISNYSVQTTGESEYQLLTSTRQQVNPMGSLEKEFAGNLYNYDQYGNVTSVQDQEYDVDLVTTTQNQTATKKLAEDGDYLEKELPKWTTKVDLQIYYYAEAPAGNADFEIRYWPKEESRPEEPYKRYVMEAAMFACHTGTVNLSIDGLDREKVYNVEILATAAGTWKSYVRVDRIDATYETLVTTDTLTKSTTYNHYANSAQSGLPDIVHTTYGANSTHSSDFLNDNCIESKYEYQHNGVDGVVAGEDYNNLFPTKIIQNVVNVDGVSERMITNLRYDRFGNKTKVEKGATVSTYKYDQLNRLTEERYQEDENGVLTEKLAKIYQYDRYPDTTGLFTTTIQFQDAQGNAINQNITRLKYNQLGQYVATWQGATGTEVCTERVTYDEFGRKKSIDDGTGRKVTYTYDPHNRLIQQIGPDQSKKMIDYLDLERTVAEGFYELVNGVYKLTGKTIKVLNETGKVERVNQYPSALGSTYYSTQYTYDLSGRVTRVIDPRGVALNYDYGSYGLETIDYPGSLRMDDIFEYKYLSNSKNIEQLRESGASIVTEYDELNRVKKISYPDGRIVKNYYNAEGRLSKSTLESLSQFVQTSYEYGVTGNVEKISYIYDDKQFSVEYIYDEVGNVIQIIYPSGYSVSYEYDDYGRVSDIPGFTEGEMVYPTKDPGDPVIDDPNPITIYGTSIERGPGIKYLSNGFMTNVRYVNGISTVYTSDAAGRVKSIKNQLLDYRYTYDGKSNVKYISSYDPLSGDLIQTYSYKYNDLDWLTEANYGANSYSYEYDPAGNRTRKIINGWALTQEYSPTELNLLTASNGTPIRSDQWGNITEGENGYQYIYNDSNQLIEVLKKGRTVGTYYYNTEGKRYKKVEGSLTTEYVYNGENILYEESPDGTKIYYIYLNGRQIAKVEEINGIRKKSFYHTDHLGSTRAVTDENGEVIGRVEYKPFGDEQPYFPGRDDSIPNQSRLEAVSELDGRLSGTKELSTDRIEGDYSVLVKTGDDPYDFANYHVTDRGYMDTEGEARYYHLWIKPEEGAEWVRFAFHDQDDLSRSYESLCAEDGDYYFKVGYELQPNQWNLIILDTRESHADGIDKGSEWISMQTDEFSQWKWDHLGVSIKDPVTYTGKQQDNPTGLYYFNARYYDPNLGRFISEDPAKDGANWYAYCSNNPMKYVDPTGLDNIYYNQSGDVINRESYWWMFWDRYFILANDGESFWPLNESLEKKKIRYKIKENGDQIIEDYIQNYKAKERWQNFFPLTVGEVLQNSPSKEAWDLKRSFKNNTLIVYNGTAYKVDYLGNMAWGYIMASRNWPERLAKMGAGFAQTFMDDTTKPEFWITNWGNLGDDPRDSEAIRIGYRMHFTDIYGW